MDQPSFLNLQRQSPLMAVRKVNVSISDTLIQYHTSGQWLASLQFCSFLTEQRIRLCPEHLFVASDCLQLQRPDLFGDFLQTFCTREQQPSLAGLLSKNMADLRPIDYIRENMAFVLSKNHHLDGIRLIKSLNSHPLLGNLVCQRTTSAHDREDMQRMLDGMGAMFLSRLAAQGAAAEESPYVLDSYCQMLLLADAILPDTASSESLVPIDLVIEVAGIGSTLAISKLLTDRTPRLQRVAERLIAKCLLELPSTEAATFVSQISRHSLDLCSGTVLALLCDKQPIASNFTSLLSAGNASRESHVH